MNQFKILSIEILLEEYEVLDEAITNRFLLWITNSGLWKWFKGKILGHDELGDAFSNSKSAESSLGWLDKYWGARQTIKNNEYALKSAGQLDKETMNMAKTAYDKAKDFLGIKDDPYIKDINGDYKGNSILRSLPRALGGEGDNRIMNLNDEIKTKANNISGGLVSWLPKEAQDYLRDHGNITTGVAAAAGILGLIYLYRKFIKNPNKKLDKQTALYAQKLNNINPNQLSQSQLNSKIL